MLYKEPNTSKFVPLTGTTEIPVGSQVDTTHGTIKLIAGLGGGKTNSANFNDGLFKMQQKKAKNAFMTLLLQGGTWDLPDACAERLERRREAEASGAQALGERQGPLHDQGPLQLSDRARDEPAVQDRCDGTLTRVLRGIVKVQDFRKHKTVNIRAGHTYLATAP